MHTVVDALSSWRFFCICVAVAAAAAVATSALLFEATPAWVLPVLVVVSADAYAAAPALLARRFFCCLRCGEEESDLACLRPGAV